MSLRSILDTLRSITPLRRAVNQRTSFRLKLESLDDRRLPSFTAPTHYAVGSSPQAVTTADLNNDGHLDLVAADYGGTVSVLLGDGLGGFGAVAQFPAGSNPSSVAVGDFNADGKIDVATASPGGNVSVLLGNGNGTLGAPADVSLSDGSSPQSVAVGDFNADGKMDLGVTSNVYTPGFYGPGSWGYYGNYYPGNWYPGYETGYAHVLLGNGLGDFADASSSVFGYGFCSSAVVTDINGDGNEDFATASYDNGTLDWLAGDGFGNLGGGASIGVAGSPESVTAGDVNGDGHVDLVMANGYSQTVAVLLGDGVGGFSPVQTSNTAAFSLSVAIADFNHDGNADIATVNTFDDSMGVLLGRGDGTFTPPVKTTVGASPVSAVGTDLNGDGWPDAATVNTGGPDIGVLLNDHSWPATNSPTVSINDASVTEGNTGSVNVTFTLTLSAISTQPVTVHYTTADGGASAGSDYSASSADVTIPAGQLTKTFTIAVLGDRLPESTETFDVNLDAATNAFIGDSQGVATILDNEPRISINDVSVTEGNTGSINATFTVSLSVAYDQAVVVHFATANGSATSGSDYTAGSGNVTVTAGQLSQTFTVAVLGDRLAESTEYYTVNLDSPSSSALITDSQGLGTILDNEPRISITNVSAYEGNGNGKNSTLFTFTVTLSVAYDQAVTMSFHTVDGSATAGQDYVSKIGTITFAPGETSKTITIEVKRDNKREANETFYLDLYSNSSNSSFTKSRGIGTILNDD